MRFRKTNTDSNANSMTGLSNIPSRKLKRPSRKLGNMSLAEGLKKYIQSFMAWMLYQNPVFADIPSEELTNFFIGRFDHPLFFQLLLRTDPFTVLSEVNQYLEVYKNKADLMKVEMPIEMIDAPAGVENPVVQWMPSNCEERVEAEKICREYGLKMPNTYIFLDHSLLCRGVQTERDGRKK